MWNLLERPARESSDPKLVDWVGEMVPGLKKNFLVGKETHLDHLDHLHHLHHLSEPRVFKVVKVSLALGLFWDLSLLFLGNWDNRMK